MQLKPSAAPAPAAPFLAVNPGPSTAGQPAEGGTGTTFAKLMESQAGQIARNAAAQVPQALSAGAKSGPAAPNAALNGAGEKTATPTEGRPAANPQDGAKALAQQQLERNRLNAQRDARQAASRAAASSPEKTNAKPQAQARPAETKATQSDQADTRDEEETADAPEGVPPTPQALLDLIQQAALARGGADGGQPPEEDTQLVAAQQGDAAALAGAATTAAAAGLPGGEALPPDTEGSGDPAGPLDAAAAPSASGKAAAGKAAHHGLNALADTTSSPAAAVGAGGKEAVSGGRAAAPAFSAEMAAAQQAQQAEMAASAAGQGGPVAGAGRGPAGQAPGGVDALGASGVAAALGGPAKAAGNDPASTVSVNIPTPAQSPEFRDALGAQVSLLAKDGVQSAELHLNPSDMGSISVQITLDGTQARVDFGADSADTRRLIESGLPELASALRDAGLTLSGGGVSQHAPQQQHRGDAGQGGQGRRAGFEPERGGADATVQPVRSAAVARRVALGGVDVYA